MLTLELIEEARRFLSGRIRRTPVEISPGLSDLAGVPVWLKLESLQVTGSFKIRGALFRLSKLSDAEKRAGVATCSAGNHGLGIALAARELGVSARVYVPRSIDESKRAGIAGLGAEILVSEYDGYDQTEAWAKHETEGSGRIFISAFDDDAIMAGNGGTLALEVLEDVPEARVFFLPVGGGGLSAGFSFVAKAAHSDSRIVACQLERSPALKLSLQRGAAVTRIRAIETAAGGLEGGIGRKTFEVLRSRVDRVALISEAEIFDAVRWMLDAHQYLIEPSAAATVAACLMGKAGRLDGPAVVVLSGRNVSLETLRRIL